MAKPKKISLAKAASLSMLGLGAASILASIVYTSSILAFTGLGLAFWGAILIYIQPEEYTKKVLLDASVMPSFATLNQIMQELDYKGKAIYLPPKYLKDPETSKVYISKKEDGKLPTRELVLGQKSRLFIKNPKGILLTPLGDELARLLEKRIGTSFTKVDLEYLIRNLPKLFVEDLEIAENIEVQTEFTKVSEKINDSVPLMQMKSDIIHVKITNTIYKDICKAKKNLSNMCNTIGCPTCSAIACIISKAAEKPVVIEKIQISEDGRNVEATYRVLETAETQEGA
jgi:hypothetical protein